MVKRIIAIILLKIVIMIVVIWMFFLHFNRIIAFSLISTRDVNVSLWHGSFDFFTHLFFIYLLYYHIYYISYLYYEN